MKIHLLTDYPDRFRETKSVFIYDESLSEFVKNQNEDMFHIVDCEVNDKSVKLKFEGYDSIESVKPLIGKFILIPETEKIKLPKGEFFYYELFGAKVFDKGNFIGEVKNIENYGSDDLLRINNGKQEFLIPNRKEFVKEIDLKSKEIQVDLIEGFFDDQV